MRVEGDDVVDTHFHKFLQSDRAVQRLPHGTLVLSSFIQVWHDNGDASCLAADRGDDTLEVLIMIVRRHVVHLAEHLIGFTVIDDINEKIEVHAAHGTLHNALAFTGSETRQVAVHDIRRSLISGKREAVLVLAFPLGAPLGQIIVNFLPDIFAAFQRDESQ